MGPDSKFLLNMIGPIGVGWGPRVPNLAFHSPSTWFENNEKAFYTTSGAVFLCQFEDASSYKQILSTSSPHPISVFFFLKICVIWR